MSILETIEKSLDFVSTGMDMLEEDLEEEGEKAARKAKEKGKGKKAKRQRENMKKGEKIFDQIKEGIDTWSKFFTALDQKGLWHVLTHMLEALEEMLKLLAKFAGAAWGSVLDALGELLTVLFKSGEALNPAEE